MNLTILAILHVTVLLAAYGLCSLFILSCIFKRAPIFVQSQPGVGDLVSEVAWIVSPAFPSCVFYRFQREWGSTEERGERGRGDRWRATGEPGERWLGGTPPIITRDRGSEEGSFLRAGDGQGTGQTLVPNRPNSRASNIPRRGRFT